MDNETLDWMDEFDDSVFTDTIEANDTSAITGFENTEASTETTSPLEANETETINTLEDTTQPSADFFTNFTPTVNFSMARAAGPSSMSNDASSKGDKPANGSSSSSTSSGSTDDKDDDKDIDLDDYYGGGKTDGDDDSDDDYGSWTDHDRAEAAKEVAEATKEAAEAAKEAAEQTVSDAEKAYQEKVTTYKEAQELSELTQKVSKGRISPKERERLFELRDKYKDAWIVSNIDDPGISGLLENAKKEVEAAKTTLNEAYKAKSQAQHDYENAVDAVTEKAKEALVKTQAAKENAGTLAGEAAKAFERAQEKQKEWEQKQKDAEANEKGDNNTTSNKDSAVNNPVTFDLAKTLSDAGAKMTETEYGQVADFVAAHPELASIIDGGLTNAEKSSVANVIAGIQAINAGNYLTAVKEFAQGFGMTLLSAVQLISSGIYGAGARIAGIIKSFMENPNINYDSQDEDFKTFKEMRDGYDGDSSELMALYKTSKGTTDQKQTFDYMKDNAATNVGEYNEGLVEDVNKVVSDASRKVIRYSPYVLEAVKKWRK